MESGTLNTAPAQTFGSGGGVRMRTGQNAERPNQTEAPTSNEPKRTPHP
jgi:hypothetical protein